MFLCKYVIRNHIPNKQGWGQNHPVVSYDKILCSIQMLLPVTLTFWLLFFSLEKVEVPFQIYNQYVWRQFTEACIVVYDVGDIRLRTGVQGWGTLTIPSHNLELNQMYF